MANINTKRKRKEGVAGYGKKRNEAVNTMRINKTPWLAKALSKKSKTTTETTT